MFIFVIYSYMIYFLEKRNFEVSHCAFNALGLSK